MKKFVSTDLGGAPINKNDLRDIFNSEVWDILEAMYSKFNVNTEGTIVSGCVISGAGPIDITAGIVYLNGEFMKLPQWTAASLPCYITPGTPINDSRTFTDTTTHVVAVNKGATISPSIPGSGQYIAITTPTDPDDRRWSPASVLDVVGEATARGSADTALSGDIALKVSKTSDTMSGTLQVTGGVRTETSGPFFKTKVIDIGDWDMDTNATKSITHGVADFTKIRSVSAIIREDSGGATLPLDAFTTVSEGGVNSIQASILFLARLAGGYFDSTTFDSTGFNRGWVTIVYEA